MPDKETLPGRLKPRGRIALALIGTGLLALGGVAGATVIARTRPAVTMAPSKPIAIRSLESGGIVTVRGRVAEVYGNKFVLDDGTGRALIETGPGDGEQALASPGATVTVQGRFERGTVHAAFLVAPDGKVMALGPLAGPRHGLHGGPGCDGRAPPPPPPGADGKAPPPPPVNGDTAATMPSPVANSLAR